MSIDVENALKKSAALIDAANKNKKTSEAIAVKTPLPGEFKADAKGYRTRQKKLDKTNEQGFVNEATGASVVLRRDGLIGLAASDHSQIHVSPAGQITQVSLENRTVTNRKLIETDDLVINNHKLNPFLYETADLRQVMHNENTAIGGFTMLGTVMVKAWDQDLKRYVMIRRLVRTPMFSPTLNLPEIPAGMNVADPTLKNKYVQVEVAANKPAAAGTTPAASPASPAAAATTPAPTTPAAAPAPTGGGLQVGSTWNSWEEQPPVAPAGLEWHRAPGGGMVLQKAYGA